MICCMSVWAMALDLHTGLPNFARNQALLMMSFGSLRISFPKPRNPAKVRMHSQSK